MRNFFLLLSCAIFFVSVGAYASAETADTLSERSDISETNVRMARFLAGVSLIRSVPAIGTTERAERLRELEAVSGVTAADAAAFLETCRNDPALWQTVSGLVVSILTEISGNTVIGQSAGNTEQ